MRAVLGEGVSDNAESGEGHDCANSPEPIRALVIDVDVGAEGIVEGVGVYVQGGVAPFVEVGCLHSGCFEADVQVRGA